MPIDLGLQVQEHRTQADRRPIHKDKGARRGDAAKPPDVAMDAVDETWPFRLAHWSLGLLLDRPDAVVEQRTVDKPCPAVQHRDHLLGEIAKAPAFVGLDGKRVIIALERVVKIDDPFYEVRRENANTAEIEEIDGAIRRHRVIPQMWVTVDDTVVIERHVPNA